MIVPKKSAFSSMGFLTTFAPTNYFKHFSMEKAEKPKGMSVKKEQELMAFLTEAFPQNSRTSLKGFLQNHKIQVNDKTITLFNHLLKIGDRVNIVKPTLQKKVYLPGVKILFEDEHLIVIDKEAGLLSIAGNNKEEETAYRHLSNYVKEENEKERIFIIHRLDKDTSGVMMYGKSQEIQESFQRNWKELVSDRTYIVVVEGAVENEEGDITSYLTENKTYMMFSSFTDNGGQKATLHYRKLKGNREFTMLEVSLETGRKNQIRVQMQAIGHPVAGDKKYGAKTNYIKRLALHAKTLNFTHPVTQKPMRFELHIPQSFYRLV